MIYKVTYDENSNAFKAEAWMELTIPPTEKESNPHGVKFDHIAWVEAESETEAIYKANNIKPTSL